MEIIENLNPIQLEYLYKYIPVTRDLDVKVDDTDHKRIMSLLNNEIWFSKYGMLNDPFETLGSAFYKNKYEEKGAAQLLNNWVNKESIAISCFCSDWNNLPLWGNYANCHQGFCLKYKINDSKNIFKVDYRELREQEFMYSPWTATSMEQKAKMGHQLSIKAIQWKYEDEYRIIAYDQDREVNGFNIKASDLGISLSSIIIGLNCSGKNEKILQMCAHELNVDVEKTYMSNKYFKLCKRKVKSLNYKKLLQ